MNKNLRQQLISLLSNTELTDLDVDYNQEEFKDIFSEAKKIRDENRKEKELNRLVTRKYRIDYTEIKATLGVPWISEDIIADFVAYISNMKHAYVSYNSLKGSWYLYKCDWVSSKFNTSRCTVLRMLEAALNGRIITIKKSDGKIDDAATIEVAEKQKLLEQEFEEWIWKDEYRKYRVMEAYNNMFDCYYQESQEGAFFSKYEGLNPEIELYEYQKYAISKILSRPNSLIATEVGTGKTYIMIVSAMEMLNNGQSKKNMFVVPNNIVGQWESVFRFLYPSSKVLIVCPQNFKKCDKEKIIDKMKNADCESIIIAYSCFDQLAVRKKAETNQKSEVVQCFEEIGVTALFVDEAHNYKNLRYEGTLPDAKGIQDTCSKKCDLMLEKVRCVQGVGGKVIFATGTPLSNSLADAFTMQVYLQYDELVKINLNIFSNWLKTFAKMEFVFEIDSTGVGFCLSKRIFRFVNLPELSKMFSKITIFHFAEKQFLPEEINRLTFSINGSEKFAEYMKSICVRVDQIKKQQMLGNSLYRKIDNMLKICTDGRKAALDLKLVGQEQEYNTTSKIWVCVNSVIKIYKDFPNCSQIIFCDYSTPKAEKYNVYLELKERLIAEGVKAEEIAFIHSYSSESEKLKLFDKVNKAEIKILIGSTCKLGVGVNVQTKLKAIHHLDVPWRPSDMVQREGRIIRTGNQNSNIAIFRYVLKGSFDAYFWQLLECKQTFISQFLVGKTTQRSTSDLASDILEYSEVKALAVSNPIIKEYSMKLNELRLEEIMLLKNRERFESLQNEILCLEEERLLLSKQIEATVENYKYINQHNKEQLKEIANNIIQLLLNNNYDNEYMTNIFDFELKIKYSDDGKNKILKIFRGGVDYELQLGKSDVGNVTRLVNFLSNFKKQISTLKDYSEKVKIKINNLKNEKTSIKFDDERLTKLKMEVQQLRSKITNV